MKDNNLNSKMRTLEKLFKVGFNTDEKIKNMKIDDIFKINELTSIDIQNIKDLIEAIKSKKVIAFFSGNNEKGNWLMKTYDIEADINGRITFEVAANSMEEAKEKVDDILTNVSVKEAIIEYQNELKIEKNLEEE